MVKEVFNEHKLPPEFAKKVIEGVPTLAWGRGKDCTFAGSLEAALAVTEHPYTYPDIMGLSGLAFRVRWHEWWFPSCTVGEMEEEIEAVSRATGWQLRPVVGKGGPDMERFTDDIVADVNAGRPVLVYPPSLDVAVAYGYRDAGKTLLLRDYHKGEKETSLPTKKLDFLLIFLGEHMEPLSPQEALVKALKIAITNWNRKIGHEGPGDYWYGKAALKTWSDDIARADTLSDEDRKSLFFVNWLNFNTVADARATAVTFLQEGAAILESDAASALQRAAKLYQQEGKFLGSVFGKKDAFLGPWSGKSIKDWSPDVRAREQEILAEAQKIENQAIAELEKALALLK